MNEQEKKIHLNSNYLLVGWEPFVQVKLKKNYFEQTKCEVSETKKIENCKRVNQTCGHNKLKFQSILTQHY